MANGCVHGHVSLEGRRVAHRILGTWASLPVHPTGDGHGLVFVARDLKSAITEKPWGVRRAALGNDDEFDFPRIPGSLQGHSLLHGCVQQYPAGAPTKAGATQVDVVGTTGATTDLAVTARLRET